MLCASLSGRLGCNTVVVGRMVRGEGAWDVCVCISYTGDGSQQGSSFLWERTRGLGLAEQLLKMSTCSRLSPGG